MVFGVWSHVQTATAAFPLAPGLARGVRTEAVEIPLDDAEGALVAVAEWQPRAAPVIVVIHGVAGSSDDGYVVRAARALGRRGWHVLRLNQRGSGRGVGRAARLYHAGLGTDVAVVRRFLEARADVTTVGVLGFSLGGHVALSHAADTGREAGKLRAVASVSAPVDLAETLRRFDRDRRTAAAFYERLMVRSLVAAARALHARQRAAGVDMPFSPAELDRIVDIRTFDDVVTCRCHGFSGIPDYHARAAVGPRLPLIEVPTLVLHAEDDPIVPVAGLRRADRSRAVDVVIVPRGGHVGFVESPAQLFGATAAVARAIAHFERHL